jgi:hypothetical protein
MGYFISPAGLKTTSISLHSQPDHIVGPDPTSRQRGLESSSFNPIVPALPLASLVQIDPAAFRGTLEHRFDKAQLAQPGVERW